MQMLFEQIETWVAKNPKEAWLPERLSQRLNWALKSEGCGPTYLFGLDYALRSWDEKIFDGMPNRVYMWAFRTETPPTAKEVLGWLRTLKAVAEASNVPVTA